MRTFHYGSTHKKDEAYMRKMCHEGWAATGLVEGVWTFEKCEPDQYVYRVCYLRGMSGRQIAELIAEYEKKGIEFVSRYSFWAIFRSTESFEIYAGEDEKRICEKIYSPMPKGAAASWIILAVSLFLAFRISGFFLVLAALAGIYGAICTWLAISYDKLLKALK